MHPPVKTSMQWKQLAATCEVADGITHNSLHLVDLVTGYDFTVTVSGIGSVNAGFWAGALTAAAHIFQDAAGVETSSTTTAQQPTSH